MNRHAQEDERRYAKEDWKQFFYAMCAVMHVDIAWLSFNSIDIAVGVLSAECRLPFDL